MRGDEGTVGLAGNESAGEWERWKKSRESERSGDVEGDEAGRGTEKQVSCLGPKWCSTARNFRPRWWMPAVGHEMTYWKGPKICLQTRLCRHSSTLLDIKSPPSSYFARFSLLWQPPFNKVRKKGGFQREEEAFFDRWNPAGESKGNRHSRKKKKPSLSRISKKRKLAYSCTMHQVGWTSLSRCVLSLNLYRCSAAEVMDVVHSRV